MPQVPNSPLTVFGSRGEQVSRLMGPGHDVDVRVADLDAHGRFVRSGADVPDFDGAVTTGGGEDAAFVRGPLQVFDAAGVAREGSRVRGPFPSVAAGGEEDFAVFVAGEQFSLGD